MSVALNETAHLSNLSYVNVSSFLAHLPRASFNSSHFNITNNASSIITMLNPLDYSREQLQMANNLVLGIFYPLLLACCTIGNVLNLIVLFREKPKGSTNVYMMSVAISDLFVLWLQLPIYLYNISPTLRRQDGFKKSFFDYYGARQWGQETFIALCDWTLIVFSLARLMAIVKPFSFRWLQTARTARIACAILLVLAGIFTIYNPIKSYCQYYRVPKTAKDPPWLTNWGAVQDQAEVAMTIFKFFALLVLNVVVVMAIRRQQTSHIGKMRAGQQSNSNRKYRNSNIILMSSVLLYLVCQFPSLMINLLTISDDIYHQYNFRKTHRQFANPFVLVAFFANYSVNFILYLTVSKKFRTQCAQLFAPCCGHPLVVKWRSRMSRLSTTRSRDDDDDGDSDDAEPQEMRLSSITTNKDGVTMTIFKFLVLLVLNDLLVMVTSIRRQQTSHVGMMCAGIIYGAGAGMSRFALHRPHGLTVWSTGKPGLPYPPSVDRTDRLSTTLTNSSKHPPIIHRKAGPFATLQTFHRSMPIARCMVRSTDRSIG
ncbi:hypothetical protein BV898_09221 [Hypsibius exemplaris]|uniref:G-protein coupled receptors family 1 profile domain-containing protein n=1 Tax=Hypsibius exemplaris TaxID=2072580 RepID=A0A1W0WNG0_HYPEX|nr:hypothetical protein BV898_09221 [Hypsibius exemplaris]